MPDDQSINVADEMSKSFLEYSMSVIISRALPDARDGLKPSQRRLLYAMHHDLSLSASKPHLKCARIVGETMGKYHPHGDGAIYPTLVNMAQPWSMREMLVDSQGNFGSVEGDAPAAMRYTEARLTHLGSSMLIDLDKDTCDHQTTYDENSTEPVVLPAAFPNLLVNGGTGIAVGMATNIPPHNLSEVVAGVCATIDNPQITIDELKTYIKGPDFPVKCQIRGYNGIDSYFRTGKGSIRTRGSIEVEENASGTSTLFITEVPYGVNRATLQQRIAELVNTKVLTGISGMRDLSDDQTRIEITLKRDARPQVVVNQLFKLTSMESSFSANMLAIHERRPKLLNIREAIECYIEHRREVVIRRTRFLLKKAEDRAETLEAFLLALGHLDDFIKIIRDSKNRDEARERLKAYDFPTATAEQLGILIRSQPSVQGDRYVFTDRQVNAILELRLYQLTAMEVDKTKGEYDGVLAEITDFMDILAKESRVLAIIKDELLEIDEKHSGPRRCEIVPDEGEIAIEDLIANDSQVVTITNRGYIKRTPLAEYRSQKRGGKGVRGAQTRQSQSEEDVDDFVEHLFTAGAHDYLMFFTDTGRVYVERVYQVTEGSRTSRGRSINNLLDLQPQEKVAAILRVEYQKDEEGNDTTFDEERAENIVFATRNGTVKKTALADFRNYRKGGIIAIKIDEGNTLIDVRLTSGEDDLCLITHLGQCVRCSESTLRSMGRATRGVRGIRPRDGDFVVGMSIPVEGSAMLVASEKGIGKRTLFSEYPTKGRGGKGMLTMKVTEKTGPVIAALAVTNEDELMLMTNSGQSVRIRVAEVREAGRNTSGVKLIGLKVGELLQNVAKVVGDDEEIIDEEVVDGVTADEEASRQDAPATDMPDDSDTAPEADSSSEDDAE